MLRTVLKITIHLVLWELIFISVAKGYNISNRIPSDHLVRRKRDDSPETLKIRYYHDNQVELVVLKKVLNTIPSFLVPIWNILRNQQESERYLIENIETICYHGVQSFSAVTYFPHSNTLHGVIDYRFYIDSLPLSDINDPNLVSAFVYPMENNTSFHIPNILNRKKRMDNKRKHPKDIGTSPKKQCKKGTKQNESRSILYPEILLVIDTSERIDTSLEHKYEKVVMYALAYWNAVDMLFKHLKRTDISINIAGIFVGKTEDVVDHILISRSSYYVNNYSRVFMLREDALNGLGREFYAHGNGLKRNSYDFLVWMTRASLTSGRYMLNYDRQNLGIAAPAADCGGMRIEERRRQMISNRAIVMHDDKYAEYQTAARELAHMMFVSDDDVAITHGSHVQRNCLTSDPMFPSSGIMDPSNDRVEGCLMWSYCSEIHFENYARSKSSCCLLNFPYATFGAPRVPIEKLTVQRQCQCYGLQSLEGMNDRPSSCTSPLECETRNGRHVGIGLPLDGTPCVDEGEPGICNQYDCILY